VIATRVATNILSPYLYLPEPNTGSTLVNKSQSPASPAAKTVHFSGGDGDGDGDSDGDDAPPLPKKLAMRTPARTPARRKSVEVSRIITAIITVTTPSITPAIHSHTLPSFQAPTIATPLQHNCDIIVTPS
jgi:hypothetical protein